MPDGYILSKNEIPQNRAPVPASLQLVLLLPIVVNAGPDCVEVLENYAANPALSKAVREKFSGAINRLSRWVHRQGDSAVSLLDLTPDYLDAYFKSIENRATREDHRGGIRALYNLLLQHGKISENPVPKLKTGIQSGDALPDSVLRLGENVAETINDHIDQRRFVRKGVHTGHPKSNHLSMLRRVAKWAEGQQINDWDDFSIGDTALFLASIPSLSGRRSILVDLRPIFAIMVEANAIKANPFPAAFEVPAMKNRSINHILNLAKNAEPGCEAALEGFARSQNAAGYLCRSTMLNYFAAWLRYNKNINSLADIKTAHLLHYREYALTHMTISSRTTYFAAVTRFLKQLYRQGLLKTNPAGPFRQGNRVEYAHALAGEVAEVTQFVRPARELLTNRHYQQAVFAYTGRFSEQDIADLPYQGRLALAKFVRYAERLQLPLQAPKSPTCKLFLKPGAFEKSTGGQGCWAFLEKMGAVEMRDGVYGATSAFIAQYNAACGLKKWAQNFTERHEHKMRRYAASAGGEKALRPQDSQIAPHQRKPTFAAAAQ